jgi:hypothetical protein
MATAAMAPMNATWPAPTTSGSATPGGTSDAALPDTAVERLVSRLRGTVSRGAEDNGHA